LISRETDTALPLKLNKDYTMNYENRDLYGMYKTDTGVGPGPRLMGADTLIGDAVYNLQDEHLGDIKEIMLNVSNGKIAYAVMSFGGVFTIGEKLFAVPWETLHLDTTNKRFTMNIAKVRFENAPGFNSDNWPNMADQAWADSVNNYYHPTSL
jgi:sporulation protein YlmC with PRC-barrel domain